MSVLGRKDRVWGNGKGSEAPHLIGARIWCDLGAARLCYEDRPSLTKAACRARTMGELLGELCDI